MKLQGQSLYNIFLYKHIQVGGVVGLGDVVNPNLDKDWTAIPEYISSGCMCALVFIMGITMKG